MVYKIESVYYREGFLDYAPPCPNIFQPPRPKAKTPKVPKPIAFIKFI
jgi:hypothetical protein